MDESQNGREVIQMLAEHLLLIVDGVLDLFQTAHFNLTDTFLR